MTLAFIGIGANLGDARQAAKDAIVCLAQQVGIVVVARSSFYRTAPVDASGDDYINAVVKIETTFTAPQLLRICHHIEDQFGRERPFRNAPRTLATPPVTSKRHSTPLRGRETRVCSSHATSPKAGVAAVVDESLMVLSISRRRRG